MFFLKSESRDICKMCNYYENCNILPKLRKSEVHTPSYDTEIYVRRCDIFSKVAFGKTELITIGLTGISLTGPVLSILLVIYNKLMPTEFPIMMASAIISLIALVSGLTALGRDFFVLRKSRHMRIRKLAKSLIILNIIPILISGIFVYLGRVMVLK